MLFLMYIHISEQPYQLPYVTEKFIYILQKGLTFKEQKLDDDEFLML